MVMAWPHYTPCSLTRLTREERGEILWGEAYTLKRRTQGGQGWVGTASRAHHVPRAHLGAPGRGVFSDV